MKIAACMSCDFDANALDLISPIWGIYADELVACLMAVEADGSLARRVRDVVAANRRKASAVGNAPGTHAAVAVCQRDQTQAKLSPLPAYLVWSRTSLEMSRYVFLTY